MKNFILILFLTLIFSYTNSLAIECDKIYFENERYYLSISNKKFSGTCTKIANKEKGKFNFNDGIFSDAKINAEYGGASIKRINKNKYQLSIIEGHHKRVGLFILKNNVLDEDTLSMLPTGDVKLFLDNNHVATDKFGKKGNLIEQKIIPPFIKLTCILDREKLSYNGKYEESDVDQNLTYFVNFKDNIFLNVDDEQYTGTKLNMNANNINFTYFTSNLFSNNDIKYVINISRETGKITKKYFRDTLSGVLTGNCEKNKVKSVNKF